jgi:hypothetical protein
MHDVTMDDAATATASHLGRVGRGGGDGQTRGQHRDGERRAQHLHPCILLVAAFRRPRLGVVNKSLTQPGVIVELSFNWPFRRAPIYPTKKPGVCCRVGGMDDLTPSQLEALRTLARKKAGDAVGFVNIADARALTDLGLAQRSREGWDITPEGQALLAGPSDTPAAS